MLIKNHLNSIFSRCFLLMFVICISFSSSAFSESYAAGNFIKEPMVLPEGSVKAFQVNGADELMGGPKASGQPGDFFIYNSRVGFVIAGIRPASGVSPLGAVVEDAGILRKDGESLRWHNVMGDSFLAFYKGGDPLLGGRLFAPVKSEILKDGTDGEAIVRFYGRDAEFELRKEQFGLGSAALKLRIIVDYILKPDSNVLEIKVTASKNSGKGVVGLGQVYLLGDGADPFIPGCGYDFDCLDQRQEDVYAATAKTVSYGWFVQDRKINFHSRIDKLVITKQGTLDIPADGEGSFSMYLAVGDGDVDSVYNALNEFTGRVSTGVVNGTAKGPDGATATDVTIIVLNSVGEAVSQTDAAEDGTFSLSLPAGDYELIAGSYDRLDADPLKINVAEGKQIDVSLSAGAAASLNIDIKDESGANIPCTVSMLKKDSIKTRFDSPVYYERRFGRPFHQNYFSASGKETIAVRPGGYEVYISRGLEYEYEMKEVEISPDATASVSAMLKRSVDTTGYLSGDFHVHAAPSFDSDDKLSEKMLSAVAAGLEVPIATDHDVRTDYLPTIKSLGLEKELNSLVGNELTTKRLGHFNMYPVTFYLNKRNHGAIDWIGLSMPEVYDAVRKDPEEKSVIQLNHPRDASLGYLNLISYNPETALTAQPQNFSWDFDAVEVLNGGGYSEMETILIDWYSFLNRGHKVTGVGNSDSHGSYSLQIGYPRNFVKSTTDIPGDMNREEFINGILSNDVTVNGGAFVTMTVNGAELGQTATVINGKVDISIKVQVPSWIKPETLKIVEGGTTVKEVDISGGNSPVYYEGTISLGKPSADTWYMVIVEGSGDLFPVYPGKHTSSFTNPIFVDVDGNGVFDAPIK